MTREENGAALVLVIMLLVLVGAIALGISLVTSTEALIAGNARESRQAAYAVEAAVARAAADLDKLSDWTAVLAGETQSGFTDGPPGGMRVLASGEELDLDRLVSFASCGKPACTEADLVQVTAERPLGPNNPRYRLFAYGTTPEMLQGLPPGTPFYVVAMVADDPSETDGDPRKDGTAPDDRGRGVVMVRAEAFGPRGTHRGAEVVLARSGGPAAERGYTGQLAGGATNERLSERPIGTPGASLGVGTIGQHD